MDYQDWKPVVLKKENDLSKKSHNTPVNNKMAKLDANDNLDGSSSKKKLDPESVKELTAKRIEMKLTQEKADKLCAFSRNTFKDLESKKTVPTQTQQSIIQKKLGVQLKII